MEGALLSMHRVAECGIAQVHFAQRVRVLCCAIVEQLAPFLLVDEPAVFPGFERATLLMEIATQLATGYVLSPAVGCPSGCPAFPDHLWTDPWCPYVSPQTSLLHCSTSRFQTGVFLSKGEVTQTHKR